MKDFKAQAKHIVENWMETQLRSEGREGIYIDDIAGLQFDISKVLQVVRDETIEDCAQVADDMKRNEEKWARHYVETEPDEKMVSNCAWNATVAHELSREIRSLKSNSTQLKISLCPMMKEQDWALVKSGEMCPGCKGIHE